MARIDPGLPELPVRTTAWQRLVERGVTLIIHDPDSTRGGGYWHPDKQLVELFTAQEEAAIHEIAHAWWDPRRLQDNNAAKLMVAVVKLSEERESQTEPLPHALAVRADALVCGLGQPDERERLTDPRQPASHVGRPPAGAREDLQVASAREEPIEGRLLDHGAGSAEHVAAVGPEHRLAQELDAPGGGEDQPERHPDRRGLAGAVRPEEPVQLPPLDAEIEAVDDIGFPVPFRQPVGDERGHGSFGSTACRLAGDTSPPTSHA